MDAVLSHPSKTGLKPWQIIGLSGLGLFLLNFLGAFWIEPYSGSCMFVLLAYFQSLVVVLPLLKVGRFGTAAAVYLPYAILGMGFVYYFEWVAVRALLSPWYALVWSLLGPLAGLLVDITHRFLPRRIPLRWRAVLLGAVLALATFTLTRWGLLSFYVDPVSISHLPFFQEKAIFSLPWMLINGAMGGYSAYSLSAESARIPERPPLSEARPGIAGPGTTGS